MTRKPLTMARYDQALHAFAQSVAGVLQPMLAGLTEVRTVSGFREAFTLHGQPLNNVAARARALGFEAFADSLDRLEQMCFTVLDDDEEARFDHKDLLKAAHSVSQAAQSLAPRHSRLFGRQITGQSSQDVGFDDSESHLQRLTILVADDESESLSYLKQMLYRLKAERVVWAENAKTAMELTRSLHPDLVISDWNLEGNAGLTLLDAMRANSDPVLAAMPFIMLSDSRCSIEISKAWSAGVSDLVMKPVTQLRLQAAIRKAVSGHYINAQTPDTNAKVAQL